MVQRRVRLSILALVVIFMLLAPVSLKASVAEPASPWGFWQSVQQMWLGWSVWWTGSDDEETTAVRAVAGATEEETGESEIVPLDPPLDPEAFGSGEDGGDGEGGPRVDPAG